MKLLTKVSEREYKLITRNGRRGSNQYVAKPKVTVGGMCGAFVLIIGTSLAVGHYVTHAPEYFNEVYAKLNPVIEITSPLPVTKAIAEVKPTVTPTPDENEVIAQEIKTVFGKDADKAFKVLSCENKALNPKAVNTAGNFPEGSRDIGVFQINEYWQGVHAKFLFDYKTNIAIAHQIYRESGNSFKMWSCSRKVGNI